MTIENITMGEQPIFTTKAHVFHIDPQTKKSWIHASANAVNVSFFYDSTRNLYRIISVEGTKAVINSTLTANMTFTKTSQKFGQWSDVRANTVYGLGFSSEADLNKFIEKFQEIKEALKQNSQKSHPNGTPAITTPVTSASASPITTRSNVKMEDGVISISNQDAVGDGSIGLDDPTQLKASHQRSQSLSGVQPAESPKHQGKAANEKTSVSPLPTSNIEAQLKYENDRLKLALAQSSANAKKWEVELQTLKNNNVRLTSALQESTANVEEWKRQLQAYKEENSKVKLRMLELEASRGNVDAAAELRKELHILRAKLETLEYEGRQKDNEVQRLTKLMDELRLQHHSSHRHDEIIKNLQLENESLKNSMNSLQRQLDATVAAQEASRRLAETLHVQLGEKLQEVLDLHREVASALST
ncbi:hypothetical protein CHUAL_000404 [Chamberlinius hualienensis]